MNIVSEMENSGKNTNENIKSKIKKRNWQERCSESKRLKTDDFVRIKRRNYAMLLGYSGRDYYGMQRNPDMRTIEEELLKALRKAELISDEIFEQPQLINFQRAARTDKGVSAVRQIVSLKLPETIDMLAINNHLPPEIHVFATKRVTKGFNSKNNCDARTYIYLLPTIAFAPHSNTELDITTFRLTETDLNHVNDVLKLFLGTKNFHNFTSRKLYKDPSAKRFIIEFICETPFVQNGVEFAVIKIKGQSFMLHQIRKMVGLTIAIVSGHTTTATLFHSFNSDRLDLPMAPGLGLILSDVHYDRYNNRYSKDHETLEWLEFDQEINDFKKQYIFKDIIETEIDKKPMIEWLCTLHLHKYDIRDDDVGKTEQNLNQNNTMKILNVIDKKDESNLENSERNECKENL